MAQHLIPSDKAIRAVRPGDPRQRLSDGAGLYLPLFVKGGSHGWRLDYTFDGRRKTLSFGTYPATELALARAQAARARELLRQGKDPSEIRRDARVATARRREAADRAKAGLPAVVRAVHSKATRGSVL